MVAAYLIAIASATVGQTASVTHSGTYSQDLLYPARLAPAGGGGIYVTDEPTGTVLEYANTSDPPTAYAIPELPVGIVLRPDIGGDGGRVLVSRQDGVVGVYDFSVNPHVLIGTLPGPLDQPNDMAVRALTSDPNIHHVYVVDSGASEVVVYEEDPLDTWTEVNRFSTDGSALGECNHPQAIAIDEGTGRVIVTDADNFRAQVFDLLGFVQLRFGHRLFHSGSGSPTAWFARGEGVALDACGNIYISDALMGTVRVFDPSGVELDAAYSPAVTYGSGAGEVRLPVDIAIEGGTLFVASAYNSAVEAYDVACTLGSTAHEGSSTSPKPDLPARSHGLKAARKTVHTPSAPDNPFDLVALMDAGVYSRKYDLNLDRRLDESDLEIAVERFGVGTVVDFVDGGGVAETSFHPPHVIELDDACGRCHGLNGLPGGMLTADGQENLCLSCHTGGGLAMDKPISGLDKANSHPRGIAADQGISLGPDPDGVLARHLDEGDIKCATCHNQHDSTFEPYLRNSIYDGDLCSECHAEGPEWELAGHADWEGEAFVHYEWTLPNRSSCRKCHSGLGFIDHTNGLAAADQRGDLQVHSCVVCHGVHENANGELLRMYDDVTLPGGVVVADAGPNAACLECHNGRYAPGTGHLTPHYLLGGVMLEGINGDDFGNTSLTDSAHTSMAGCVNCHMAPAAASGKVGGHTFNMAWHNPGGTCTGGIDDGEDCMVDADCDDVDPDDGLGTCTPTDPDHGFENVDNACNSQACHGAAPLTVLNRTAWADYDNDTFTEGIQDEVQGLLDLVLTALGAKGAIFLGHYPYWSIPGVCAVGNFNEGELCYGDTDCDDAVLDDELGTCDTHPDDAVMRSAIWNYEFVDNDGSLGVHNTDYAVGLLQITYEKLTGAPLPANRLYTP